MAKKSNNERGNPWHDEEGKFTSEGAAEVREALESEEKSAKTQRIEEEIENLGIEGFISRSLAKNSGKTLRYYVDDNLSVPLVMKYERQICDNLLCDKVVVNNDDELDKYGIDLIGYDADDDDVNNYNYIDVKTAYFGAVRIPFFKAEMDRSGVNHIKRDWLLNPNTKATNWMILNFINCGSMKDDEKTRELYNLGTDKFADEYVRGHEIYMFDKQDIFDLINSYIGINQIQKFYDEYSSYFNSIGTINDENGLIDFVSNRIGRLRHDPRYGGYKTEMVDKETGFALTISFNPKEGFGGVHCEIKIPQAMLQKFYNYAKIN